MKVGEIYFWLNEYNFNNDCYAVVEDNGKEYQLMRVHIGKPMFTDFWRISYNYYEKNKNQFIKTENEEQYRELCEKKNNLKKVS